MSIIKLDAVTKYYGKNKGIENLSLAVNEGDIYGFIGPNGAGKSTTIRLMMNFIFPNTGQIEIFGENVIKNAEYIKKQIGYLPSEVYFYDTMKVADLLDYAASLKGIEDKRRIKMLVDAFDLDVNRKFGNLSLGNKKKVSIIQAMMHTPKLLILDEPTNGLDPLVQKTLLELVREENKKGTTVFFSSHSLSVVQKMCNKVGIIKEGEMLDVESYESIKKKRIKKIFLEADVPILKELLVMPEIENLDLQGHHADFYYRGEINKLFDHISALKITDFNMSEPDLEEIFMHFYQNVGGHHES